jgi:hypothetical protein
MRLAEISARLCRAVATRTGAIGLRQPQSVAQVTRLTVLRSHRLCSQPIKSTKSARNWDEPVCRYAVQARALMIMGLSTVGDHRGVPCLPCHHACWSRSGVSLLPCSAANARSSTRLTRWAAIAGGSQTGVVFEHVVAALVHGSGYERIASAGCSDRTIRWSSERTGPRPRSPCVRWTGLPLDDTRATYVWVSMHT